MMRKISIFDADEFSSNIEKSIDDRISSIKGEYDEIIKGLKDELKEKLVRNKKKG